jgi:hypothetical protein
MKTERDSTDEAGEGAVVVGSSSIIIKQSSFIESTSSSKSENRVGIDFVRCGRAADECDDCATGDGVTTGLA